MNILRTIRCTLCRHTHFDQTKTERKKQMFGKQFHKMRKRVFCCLSISWVRIGSRGVTDNENSLHCFILNMCTLCELALLLFGSIQNSFPCQNQDTKIKYLKNRTFCRSNKAKSNATMKTDKRKSTKLAWQIERKKGSNNFWNAINKFLTKQRGKRVSERKKTTASVFKDGNSIVVHLNNNFQWSFKNILVSPTKQPIHLVLWEWFKENVEKIRFMCIVASLICVMVSPRETHHLTQQQQQQRCYHFQCSDINLPLTISRIYANKEEIKSK